MIDNLSEAQSLVQEIVGDFVVNSRESPQEINMANDLMRLQNILLDINIEGDG